MWFIFGVGAMVTCALNLLCYLQKKKADSFRFVSLSLTALTVCAFYAQSKAWVIAEDWSAIIDVIPATSTMLWILVICSIVANGISLWHRD